MHTDEPRLGAGAGILSVKIRVHPWLNFFHLAGLRGSTGTTRGEWAAADGV